MGNEGPYGGKIEIREDGSIVWQAAARSFPKAQDRTDSLDYAIRVMSESRDICASSDGKCIIRIRPKSDDCQKSDSGNSSKQSDPDITAYLNANTVDELTAMLIVSGYEVPEDKANGIVVGKSYFITGALRNETGNYSNVMAPYDIHLTFDNYDLERAVLQTGCDAKIIEQHLSLCYQHWVSLRRIWKNYRFKRWMLLTLDAIKVQNLAEQDIWKPFSQGNGLDEDGVKSVIAWHQTYNHLLKQGFSRRVLDGLAATGFAWLSGGVDFWLSHWRSVKSHMPDKPDSTTQFVDYPSSHGGIFMNLVDGSFPSYPAKPPAQQSPLTLEMIAATVENALHLPELTNEDMNAWSVEKDGSKSPISGLYVIGNRAEDISGSRTVVVKEIKQPGTFALMFHLGRNKDDPCDKDGSTDHDASSEHHHSLADDEFFTDDFITVAEDRG